MGNLQFRKAERKQAKLRVGVSGPSGSGKTYSALLLAKGIASSWEKVALIDSENGSGELYSDLGQYNIVTLTAPFSPERYIEAIKMCEEAGMEVIVIDSATHEWDGKGGCLEIQEQLGGRYQDWAKVTPRHQKFIQAIIESPVHIITTTRRKQDYEMTNEGGKVKVQKVGLKEVQREGFEYELTLAFEVNIRHYSITSKDRTGLFVDKPEFIITEETGKTLKTWADSGVEVAVVTDYKALIKAELAKLGVAPKTLAEAQGLIMGMTRLDYTEVNFEEILKRLIEIVKKETPPDEEVPAEPAKTATSDKLKKSLKKKDPVAVEAPVEVEGGDSEEA